MQHLRLAACAGASRPLGSATKKVNLQFRSLMMWVNRILLNLNLIDSYGMPHLSQETPMSLPLVEDDVCVSLMLTQGSCSSNTLTRMFWKSSTPCLGLSYHGETSWLQARTSERSACMTWPEESHSMSGHTRRECPSTQWPSKMTTPATCLQPAMTAQSTCGTLANHLHLSLKMSTLPTS